MLPNFIIGGAAAAGTSFLSSILMQHEDVYLPKQMRPEPHYFHYSYHYKNPIEWYSQKWFSDWDGQKAVGERSSWYLAGPDCPARIFKHLPDVKLIFTIRDPVERAWANYRFTVLSGLDELDFETALDLEHERTQNEEGKWAEIQPRHYTGRSYYGKQIRNYLKYFSWEQILLVSSEKLSKDTDGELKRICDYLGVPHKFDYEIPPNFASLSVINPAVQKECRDHFKDRFDFFVENTRLESTDVENLLLDDIDREMYSKLRDNLGNKKEDMDPAIRIRLRNLFESDSEDFFNVCRDNINFDQSVWKSWK